VRIFTPTTEVPFAGHPNIGTATALALAGRLGALDAPLTIRFEEKAGLVPIVITPRPGRSPWCSLTAPERLSLGPVVPVNLLAAAASLDPAQVSTIHHPPRVASVGLPFVFAELRDRSALGAATPNIDGARALRAQGIVPDVHLYLRSGDDFDLRARMFAPLDGVLEDPATGSASCALAGLLAHLDGASNGSYRWRIAQGVEMGRPSLLEARAEKRDGLVVETGVAGSALLVMEGHIEVE
jgi:trans-2,3-dihydro-3-hydroxyanthranilate isomerase